MNGEMGLKDPIPGFAPIRYAGLFGEYTNNIATSNGNSAFLVGLMFGDEKSLRMRQWYFMGSWRRLEKDPCRTFCLIRISILAKPERRAPIKAFGTGCGKKSICTPNYFRGERISSPAALKT